MRLPLLLCLLASGCPAPTNPQAVWVAPDGSESVLKLVDREPEPF